MPTRIIITLLFIAVLIANYVFGTGMEDLATRFPFEIMPPGIFFAIAWPLIYLGLSIFHVQFLRGKVTLSQQTSGLIIASHALNIAWIAATYQQQYILSVFLIIALAVVLYHIIKALYQPLRARYHRGRGLYAGWVLMASSVIAPGQLIYDLGLQQLALSTPRQLATPLLGLTIAIMMRRRFKHWSVIVLSVWALVGVLLGVFGL